MERTTGLRRARSDVIFNSGYCSPKGPLPGILVLLLGFRVKGFRDLEFRDLGFRV